MYDEKLEERKQSFKRVKTSITKNVEGYAHLLRKSFRESTITRHRTKHVTPNLTADSIDTTLNKMQTEEQLCSTLSNLRLSITNEEFKDGVQVFPLVLSLLSNDSVNVQKEAASVVSSLSNLDLESVVHCFMQVECVRMLISLIVHKNTYVQVHILHSLANVTASREKYRNMIIEEGVVDKLITLFNAKCLEPEIHDAAIFLICNIFAAGSITSTYKIKTLIPYVIEALWITREESLSDALWTLKYITENEALASNLEVVNTDTVTMILIHVQSKSMKIANPAFEVFGNLSAGTDFNGELLTTCGAIDVLKMMLETSEFELKRREAAWILSNLVACGPLVISEFLAVKGHLTVTKYLNAENIAAVRSEERRVGKECGLRCRSRWSPYH
jgi:hypothetical protein